MLIKSGSVLMMSPPTWTFWIRLDRYPPSECYDSGSSHCGKGEGRARAEKVTSSCLLIFHAPWLRIAGNQRLSSLTRNKELTWTSFWGASDHWWLLSPSRQSLQPCGISTWGQEKGLSSVTPSLTVEVSMKFGSLSSSFIAFAVQMTHLWFLWETSLI